MPGLLILARAIHIGSGVFWAGSVIFINVLLAPSVMDSGPAGFQVMMRLSHRKFFQTIVGFAYLTVLSGLWMIWYDSRGLGGAWFSTHFGMGISTGMTAPIIALIIGVTVVGPTLKEIGRRAGQIEAAPPEERPALMAQLEPLRNRLKAAGKPTVMLLAVAVLAMAVSRYL